MLLLGWRLAPVHPGGRDRQPSRPVTPMAKAISPGDIRSVVNVAAKRSTLLDAQSFQLPTKTSAH